VKRAAVVLLAWGAWLGAWTAVQSLFIHATFPERTIQWVMLGGAAAATLAAGVIVWRLDHRLDAGEPASRLLTDQSVASATLVVGLAVALVGASFGLWLILIGAGVAAFGLGGLVREQLARRRAVRGRSGAS
jgi:hypothetical protein